MHVSIYRSRRYDEFFTGNNLSIRSNDEGWVNGFHYVRVSSLSYATDNAILDTYIGLWETLHWLRRNEGGRRHSHLVNARPVDDQAVRDDEVECFRR